MGHYTKTWLPFYYRLGRGVVSASTDMVAAAVWCGGTTAGSRLQLLYTYSTQSRIASCILPIEWRYLCRSKSAIFCTDCSFPQGGYKKHAEVQSQNITRLKVDTMGLVVSCVFLLLHHKPKLQHDSNTLTLTSNTQSSGSSHSFFFIHQTF